MGTLPCGNSKYWHEFGDRNGKATYSIFFSIVKMLENQENQGDRVIHHKISKETMISLQQKIYYSDKYTDDDHEYRHVLLPKEISRLVPKTHLMSETEWRSIGVQQSHGWVHYMRHEPEPHVLLFRRRLAK